MDNFPSKDYNMTTSRSVPSTGTRFHRCPHLKEAKKALCPHDQYEESWRVSLLSTYVNTPHMAQKHACGISKAANATPPAPAQPLSPP